MTKAEITRLITTERHRQEALREMGKFSHTLATPGVPDSMAVTVLTEELGEVARAVCDEDKVNLQDELVQLAACCCAWLERL